MKSLEALERELDAATDAGRPREEAARLLALAEEVLEAWVAAHGAEPTAATREGFRLLALHHQGARGIPSFNACRETCREIAWHFNVLADSPPEGVQRTLAMMQLLARHLFLFVSGKMEVDELGEFCCASKPLRRDEAIIERP